MAQCDLSDHLFNGIDLNGALLEDAPNLINQLVDHILIADALGQVLEELAGYIRQAPLSFSLGFAGRIKEQPQVNRHYLGEVVVRLLLGNKGVGVSALRDG